MNEESLIRLFLFLIFIRLSPYNMIFIYKKGFMPDRSINIYGFNP